MKVRRHPERSRAERDRAEGSLLHPDSLGEVEMLRLRPVRRGGRDSAQHDVVIVFFFLLLLITPLRAADRLDLFYYVPYDDSWLSNAEFLASGERTSLP